MKKEILINKDNLTENDITNESIRVKIILINKYKEILMGYQSNTYQFVGGHKEKNETLVDAINREIKEETGIELNLKKAEPFYLRIEYYKDHPEVGKNYASKIYYFKINCNETPNIANTNYTKAEKEHNFKVEYISLKNLRNKIEDNLNNAKCIKTISNEIIHVLNKYYDYLLEDDNL